MLPTHSRRYGRCTLFSRTYSNSDATWLGSRTLEQFRARQSCHREVPPFEALRSGARSFHLELMSTRINGLDSLGKEVLVLITNESQGRQAPTHLDRRRVQPIDVRRDVMCSRVLRYENRYVRSFVWTATLNAEKRCYEDRYDGKTERKTERKSRSRTRSTPNHFNARKQTSPLSDEMK